MSKQPLSEVKIDKITRLTVPHSPLNFDDRSYQGFLFSFPDESRVAARHSTGKRRRLLGEQEIMLVKGGQF